MTINRQRRENLRRAGSMIDRFRQRTPSQRRRQAARFLEEEGPRIRARRNNASISGSLDFLNEGRNVAFPYGTRRNGSAMIRSEDSHALAIWLLQSNTNPWTRGPVSAKNKYRVFRKALSTNNGTRLTETQKRSMRQFMRNYLNPSPGSPPGAPRPSRTRRHRAPRSNTNIPLSNRRRSYTRGNILPSPRSGYMVYTPGSRPARLEESIHWSNPSVRRQLRYGV